MYDDILRFADDIVIVTTEHNNHFTVFLLNPVLDMVNVWMTEIRLQVASHKSEAVVLTKKWAYSNPRLVIVGQEISVVKSAKYLEI